MATSSERINSMYANSATWGSKEEELKGRASMHESQIRKCSGANKRAFANTTVKQEDLDKERAASAKKKQDEDSELSGFKEAMIQEDASTAPKAVPGIFQAKGRDLKDSKASKVRGVVAVKKQRCSDDASEAALPAASSKAVAASSEATAADCGSSEAQPEAVAKTKTATVNTAPKRRCFQDGGSCFSPPKRRLARNVSEASVETWTPESRRIMQPHRTLLARSSNESDISVDNDAQSPASFLFLRRGLDVEEPTEGSGTLHVYEEGRMIQCLSSDLKQRR